MRPLIPSEIELLSKTLVHLRGARFQKILSSAEDLVLEFWLKGEIYYLWFQDSTLRPYLTFWPDKMPFQFKKKVTPIALFLNAHFVGRHLLDVEYLAEEGRVLRLYFDELAQIEFRVFPHGQNVLAQIGNRSGDKSGNKKLSWHKVSELKSIPLTTESDFRQDSLRAPRSVFDFSNEWHLHRQPLYQPPSKSAKSTLVSPKESTKDSAEVLREKALAKINRAIDKVEEELSRKRSLPWRQVGDFLKTKGSYEDLPVEYEEYVDRRRRLSWNMNQVFEKAKENDKKIVGTLERLAQLKDEKEKIALKNFDLLAQNSQSQTQSQSKSSQVRELKEKLDGARSLKLAGDLRVLSGKSAKDNLNLLRQAKGWDLWLHLRDFPSSHAIIFRPKGRAVIDSELDQAVQWFFKQNFGPKWKSQIGEKLDVVVTECRYVKPIKGDSIGRVHYQNEKVLRRIVKAT